ncbi:hypothetical protein [Cellulomonas timonensis]|uniref:hypothetical protein n=1 Tax=Cellulomonas timonensis TaxID=1689271 RepID=UPI0008316A5B|nr:hypothetical protein [Cellulomonas timonensis]
MSRLVRRALLGSAAALVLTLVWVGVRGALAVSAVMDAAPAIADVATTLSDGPTPQVLESVDDVRAAVDRARAHVGDPVWTAAQHLPVIGERLESIRAAVTAADILSDDALGPVVALSQFVSFGPFDEDGEGFTSLVEAGELDDDLTHIADAVLRAHAELDGISTDLFVPIASDPFAEAVAHMEDAADVASVLSPAVQAMLVLNGYGRDTATLVVFLDDRSARPLGGTVERIMEVHATNGRVTSVEAVDATAVMAAANASEAMTTAAAGAQAPLLTDRPSDVAQLATTADAAAALRAGVAAALGRDAGAVVFLTSTGVDALAQAQPQAVAEEPDAPAAPGLTAALTAAAPEARAELIDAAAASSVVDVLGLTARADLLALAVRDAVVGGGLRLWFAASDVQAPLAASRGGGGLPATTSQGTPVTVTADSGGSPSTPTVGTVSQASGTCGAPWSKRPESEVRVELVPSAPGTDPAPAVAPRILVGMPRDARVSGITDARGSTLASRVLDLDSQRVLLVETAQPGAGPAGVTELRVRVAGRAGQAPRLDVVVRGGAPAPDQGTFSCS